MNVVAHDQDQRHGEEKDADDQPGPPVRTSAKTEATAHHENARQDEHAEKQHEGYVR